MDNKHQCGWNPIQSYLNLSEKLYQRVFPQVPTKPEWVIFNKVLAQDLGLNADLASMDSFLNLLSGAENQVFESPIAQAYAGHQFGHFTILGDGRAVLLGEHIVADNQKVDIQLKGSGETPYSRRGDGKATLRSMLREYIVSEAMFGLNIPTTRSLAVVKSGDEVYREYVHEGAVLTRIAQSHIRVGTFEFATRNLNKEEFKTFADYVIERHFPELSGLENPYLELLKSVMFKQIDLIVEWMRVGFIHGVMNTDNMSIAGETIDYGPCAFMNAYHPETVFSSIDKQGRYSFGNQPGIAQWNIAVFAGSLLPLIDESSEKALSAAQAVVNQFPTIFQNRWMKMMGKKMGFNSMGEKEQRLVVEFLELLQECKADYTNSFLFLMGFELPGIEALKSNERFLIWKEKWKNEVLDAKTGELMNGDDMKKSNPKIIPRNHLVENVLNKAETGDYEELHDMLNVLNRPYGDLPEQFYTSPPQEGDLNYKTYCGT